ncbi:MAG: hypothetical protein BMS9Abin28_2172 [Anaerolineae bacterium]|nr:MAG: hypothetical protein BMS9Abin28_2172 [Anaerolineae bacterium]
MARRWRRMLVFGIMALVLVGAVFLVKIQVSPWYVGMGDDSGLFAYAGELISEGALLYQDIWDTKPPGIFYLNALAVILGGDTPWAIWWFELIWTSLTGVVLLWVLVSLTGTLAGFAATFLVMMTALHPAYVSGGNYTESYALLPQVLTLAAATAYFRTTKSIWIFIMGLLTAAAFLLKPTYIALGVASLGTALVAVRGSVRRPSALRHLALFGAGFLLPVLLAAAYWSFQGGLDELWEAVFRQNVIYVREGFSIRSLYGTGRKLVLEQPLASLVVLTLASFVMFAGRSLAGGLSAWPPPEPKRATYRRWLLFVAFAALPLEIAFVAVSGRNFGHYFLTPLPAMSVAIAYLFLEIQRGFQRRSEAGAWFPVAIAVLAGLLFAWGIEVFAKEAPEPAHIGDLFQRSLGGEYWTDELEQYVMENSDADDLVLAWGYNPGLYFLADRRAPTRYLFHAQLLTPGPAGRQRFEQFMADIEHNPPILIVAQTDSPHAIPYFAGDLETQCPDCTEDVIQRLQALATYVGNAYELVTEVNGWLIHQYKG